MLLLLFVLYTNQLVQEFGKGYSSLRKKMACTRLSFLQKEVEKKIIRISCTRWSIEVFLAGNF